VAEETKSEQERLEHLVKVVLVVTALVHHLLQVVAVVAQAL
jgi:hypothetical protein